MIALHRNDAVAAFLIAARSVENARALAAGPARSGTAAVAAENVMSKGFDRFLGLLAWPLAAFDAYIFIFYLQYKFTGHPGSVELFTTLTDWLGFAGHEKFMRIGTGSMELIASILLVIPATQVVGAPLALAIMPGAIFFHLVSPLGVGPHCDCAVPFKQACER